MSVSRGAFIVFEGLDKTGKSTQTQLLYKYLLENGFKTNLIHFPERTSAIGQVINSYLTNAQELPKEVIHLMFSANRWEHMKKIQEELQKGTTLICDRYAYSGAAYSVAKGLDFDWCCSADRGLVKPDAVIYLKPSSAEQLASRGGYGDERYEKLDFQLKVADVFDKFCEEESSYWHPVDACKSKDNLSADIAAIVDKVLKEKKYPLATLT